jgi:hypothetical protein
VLKKAGFVTAAAVALSVVAAPAFAATAPAPQDSPVAIGLGGDSGHGDYVSFPEAYHTFIMGGGMLGAGAAALVAGAYAGIATTPAEILHSVSH